MAITPITATSTIPGGRGTAPAGRPEARGPGWPRASSWARRARIRAGRSRCPDELGATVSGVKVPDPQALLYIAMRITRSQASTLHARIARERPHELQPMVRARLEVGFGISAYDYLQALRLRARLTRSFIRDVFSEVDVLLTPTIPEPAPAREPLKALTADEFNVRAGSFSRLTRPFNAYGLPALSVPCGQSQLGLPLAFQLVGRPFDE